MKFALVALAAASLMFAADLKLGKPMASKKPMTIATLLANVDGYTGKTVSVSGRIAAVCQEMGCWMDLVNDAGQKVRIKVNDGEIEFPKDSAGKTAVTEGKFSKIVLTREQALAQAEEDAHDSGRKFDPDAVKGGAAYFQIQATGARIVTR